MFHTHKKLISQKCVYIPVSEHFYFAKINLHLTGVAYQEAEAQ
jgi:hypothetical protein